MNEYIYTHYATCRRRENWLPLFPAPVKISSSSFHLAGGEKGRKRKREGKKEEKKEEEKEGRKEVRNRWRRSEKEEEKRMDVRGTELGEGIEWEGLIRG